MNGFSLLSVAASLGVSAMDEQRLSPREDTPRAFDATLAPLLDEESTEPAEAGDEDRDVDVRDAAGDGSAGLAPNAEAAPPPPIPIAIAISMVHEPASFALGEGSQVDVTPVGGRRVSAEGGTRDDARSSVEGFGGSAKDTAAIGSPSAGPDPSTPRPVDPAVGNVLPDPKTEARSRSSSAPSSDVTSKASARPRERAAGPRVIERDAVTSAALESPDKRPDRADRVAPASAEITSPLETSDSGLASKSSTSASSVDRVSAETQNGGGDRSAAKNGDAPAKQAAADGTTIMTSVQVRSPAGRAPRDPSSSRSRASMLEGTKAKRGPSSAASDMSADTARVSSAIDPTFIPVIPPPVGPSTTETAKTMTVVTVPTPLEPLVNEDGAAAHAVRAAEALGHKRVLLREAHGQILVPELGRIEVRAHAEASRVDVHVRADDDHARHVIAANAPELLAHVRVDVPTAAVHVERAALDFSGGNASSRDLGRDGDTARDSHDGEAPAAEQAPTYVKGARVRFVL